LHDVLCEIICFPFKSIHKFWISGNFPETALQTINYRQATHHVMLIYGF